MKQPLLLQEANKKNPSFSLVDVLGVFERDSKKGRKEEVSNGSSTELRIWQFLEQSA